MTAKRAMTDCVDIWVCCCALIYTSLWSVVLEDDAVFA